MSRQYASQLLLKVYPSAAYFKLLVLIALLAALSVFLLEINFFPYKILFFIVTVYFFSKALRRNVLTELQWMPDGEWLLTRNKQQVVVKLASDSLVTPFLTLLNFKTAEGRKFPLIIFKDNIDSEDFRRLRVRLKVEGIASSTRDTIDA